MQDIPVVMSGYRFLVTEPPTMKMRDLGDGRFEPVVNAKGETQFVVTLFAKQVSRPGEKSRKGEEITVNLPLDPGEFVEGSYVELLDPVVNTYAIPDREDPRKIAAAGLWWKAAGLKPAGRTAVPSAA